jgi:hypothetical protein
MTIYKQASGRMGTLTIKYDECPSNPREEFDNLGKIICWHRRYNLGDKHNYSEPRDFLEDLAQEFGMDSDKVYDKSMEELMKFIEKHVVILPIYAYEHGAITIRTHSFSCPWDSGQVGWIYVTKEDIRKEYGVKRVTKKLIEKVESVLTAEVKTYDDYLNGNVFGFVLENPEGREIDSCWGFIGTDGLEELILAHIGSEYKKLVDSLEYV